MFRSSTGREATLTDAIPVPGGENPRINLWLSRGMATTSGRECEVVISKFEFVPAAG